MGFNSGFKGLKDSNRSLVARLGPNLQDNVCTVRGLVRRLAAQMWCFLVTGKGRNVMRTEDGETAFLFLSPRKKKKFNTGKEVHQFKPLLAPLCAEVNSVYYVLRSSFFKVVPILFI